MSAPEWSCRQRASSEAPFTTALLDVVGCRPRKGGSHADDTGSLALLLVRPRTSPDRAGADRQPQKRRERHYVRDGLSSEPIQLAEPDQQIEHQATGADLEYESEQRRRRIGAADHLQRRDVRGERTLDVRSRRCNGAANLADSGRI